MTKEEVLGKYCSEHGTFLHLSDTDKVIDGDANAVLEAMDEWSKEVAIGFGQWITDNNWSGGFNDAGENHIFNNDHEYATSEQLYDLYLEHLKQQK